MVNAQKRFTRMFFYPDAWHAISLIGSVLRNVKWLKASAKLVETRGICIKNKKHSILFRALSSTQRVCGCSCVRECRCVCMCVRLSVLQQLTPLFVFSLGQLASRFRLHHAAALPRQVNESVSQPQPRPSSSPSPQPQTTTPPALSSPSYYSYSFGFGISGNRSSDNGCGCQPCAVAGAALSEVLFLLD